VTGERRKLHAEKLVYSLYGKINTMLVAALCLREVYMLHATFRELSLLPFSVDYHTDTLLLLLLLLSSSSPVTGFLSSLVLLLLSQW
jgi:hypothetical protein